jgi:NAD(P)-dependent dehydrogenase (short-subunit alcohol dehydrogenase family)
LAMFDLTDKVAVVTGGTGVLGSVMCAGLAAAGAKVAVMGRNADKAQEVVDGILVRARRRNAHAQCLAASWLVS